MKKSPRHILPAALLFSAALHLLAYGSFIAYLGRRAETVRPGEGRAPVRIIEIGLVETAPPVTKPAPDPDNDTADSAAVAAESETALFLPPDPPPPRDQPPDTLPAEAGRAGREEESAGPAGDDYLELVRRKIIEAATTYPRRARLSRLQGKVRVGFFIDPDGTLRETRLIDPSPHGLFNRAALDILKRAAPFPPPAAGWGGNMIRVWISFESAY